MLAALSLLPAAAFAGTPTLTFTSGWVGEYTSAINQPINIYAFDNGTPDLNIKSVTISQNSSSNQFELQGNDIPVTITVNFVNGTRQTVGGAVNWRETASGGVLRAIGLRIDQGITDGYPLTSPRKKTYILKVPNSSLTIPNGDQISGNAALSSVLTSLNEHLDVTSSFSVSKTAAASVVEGGSLAYTIGIGNTGGGPSGTSVTVQDELPTGATFVSASVGTRVSAVSCSQSGQTLTCTATLSSAIPAYSAKGTAAFTINTTAPTVGASITNYVSVDPNGTASPPTAAGCTSAICANAATTLTGSGVVTGSYKRGNGTAVSGLTVNLLDPSDNVIATATTNSSGVFSFLGLRAGTYGIRFVSSGSLKAKAKSNAGTASGEYIRNITVNTGATISDADAIVIDPAGVIYNSLTRQPVAGAVVKFLFNGNLVNNAWLDQTLGGPNSQTTSTDGKYSFVLNGTAQTGTYTIDVTTPTGYTFQSTAIAPTAGPYDPGLGGGVVAIQSQSTAPTGSDSTTYYLGFSLTVGTTAATTSNGVINNHIPIDPVRTVSIANTTNGTESGTTGVMTVSLSTTSGTNTVVTYSVAGTATSGTDYTAPSGTVTIPANQTSATISIPVVDDASIDPGETVVVTLTAVTGGTAELSSNAANITATNTIVDNDGNNPPAYTNTNSVDGSNAPAYAFSYAENSTTSTTLGTVTASDPEGDTLTYSITAGNSNGWYAINSSTGVITLTAAGVASLANDFEQATNSRAITVSVADAALSTSIQVTLSETNVNDGTPAFTSTNSTGTGGAAAYSFNYAENTASGTKLGTLTASDSDGDTLTYSITGGNSNGWYTINSSTGVISLTTVGAASLANDFEQTPNTQNVIATVSDGTNSTTIEVKLNETNLNDATPTFTSTNATGTGGAASYDFSYTEGRAWGVTVATVSASDADADTLTFSITGGNSSSWYAINSFTGAISLTPTGATSIANNFSSLPNSRVLTVTVSDGVNSTTIEVKLNETSGANGAPGFTNTNATSAGNAAAYSFNYAENSASGATLGVVSASDPENNPLTYAISAGNSSGWYAINPTTGAITLTAAGVNSLANDFEQSPNVQTLTVTVTDGTSTTSIEVRLNETNVNDAAPVFINTNSTGPGGLPSYKFSYAENSPAGAVLGTVSAVDLEGDALTFAIAGGNANNWYAINAATGAITLTAAGAASLANDFELAPNSQTLVLTVSDGLNTSTITLILNETDLDDVAALILGPSGIAGATDSAISVNENQTAVTRLTSNEPVTWSISGGSERVKFAIAADGTITFVTAPDFERPTDVDTNNTYILTVTATDAAGNVSTQTITVAVLDVDDTAPVITGPSGGPGAAASALSLNEGLTPVTNFTANETVTWSIEAGSDGGNFRIDPRTGALVFVAATDFENPTDSDRNNTYVVRIKAVDAAGNASYQTLTVTVLNVDEIARKLGQISDKLRSGLRAYVVQGLGDMLSFNESLMRAANDDACSTPKAKKLSGAANANQSGGQVKLDYSTLLTECGRRSQVFADFGVTYSKLSGDWNSRLFASLRFERRLDEDLTLGAALLASRASDTMTGFTDSSISDESLHLNLYSRYVISNTLRTGAFIGLGRGWYDFGLTDTDGFVLDGKMVGKRQVYGWMLSGEFNVGDTVVTTDAIISHAKEKLGSATLAARYLGESRSGILFAVGSVDTTRISVPVTAPIQLVGNDQLGKSARLLLSPGLLCEDNDVQLSSLRCGYQMGARLVANDGGRNRFYADYRWESVSGMRRSLLGLGYAYRFGDRGLELALEANRGLTGMSGQDNRALISLRLAQ